MLSKRGQGSSSGGGIGLDDLTDILGREKADAQSNPDLGDLLGGILGGGLGGALGGALGGDAATSGGAASAPARRGGGLADILGSLFGRKSR